MPPEVPQHSSLDSSLLIGPARPDSVQSSSELPSDLEGMVEMEVEPTGTVEAGRWLPLIASIRFPFTGTLPPGLAKDLRGNLWYPGPQAYPMAKPAQGSAPALLVSYP